MSAQKKIVRRQYDKGLTNTFTNVHPLLQHIYAARDIQTTHELERQLINLIPYETLLGIEKAVALLAETLREQKRILIVGDFDADGATSTALAVRALRSFGAKEVQFLVPNRFAFGYGLTPELVEQAKGFSPHLIVTVDNGIANHAGVIAAKTAGIKVLITDHHLAAETLPPADVIVNPNQPHDTFKSKNLAGVGVIFYVMLALRRHLMNVNWFEEKKLAFPNMASFLDLVALGTVADLVQLDHNNRVLVYQGLKRIRSGHCIPAILALLELGGRDFSQAKATDLSFAVASRLNAAGRIDDMALGIECLLCDDSYRVREMARKLDQLNKERKSIEQDMQSQALRVLNQLNLDLKGELPIGLCLYDEGWHQGVIGILASRIKEKFNRPVIVFAPGQTGELKGSARSISGLHIRDVLARIDSKCPGLIMKFGGHAMAAGLTIARDLLDNFVALFDETVSALVNKTQLEHILISDGALRPEYLSVEIVDLLRDAGPWGQAFPEPIFDDVFEIVEQQIVGDKHLKLRLSKNGKLIDAIAFFVNLNEWPNHRCKDVHVVYRLDSNDYKGRRKIQLIVEYLQPM